MEEAFYIFVIIVSAAISVAGLTIIAFVILEAAMERRVMRNREKEHAKWKEAHKELYVTA